MKSNKDSKIYISGHRGLLGSAMVSMLQAKGYRDLILRSHNELDLSRQADVEHFFAQEQPEYVFHIAAKSGGVLQNKEHPTEYLTEGTNIALNVLNAAHIYGAKGVVYVASANVYPENAPQPMGEELLMTGRPPILFAGYALSKIVGIQFCESVAQQFGKHFVSAVLPGLYGLNDFGTTVIPMLLDKFAAAVLNDAPQVTVWGTGNACREFINSKDAADALYFLMEHGENGQYYNVGSGKEYKIRELAALLKEISGFHGEIQFDTSKPESAGRRLLDARKLSSLDWAPRIPFEQGLREAYQQHLEYIKASGKSYG